MSSLRSRFILSAMDKDATDEDATDEDAQYLLTDRKNYDDLNILICLCLVQLKLCVSLFVWLAYISAVQG